jgi:hypothetical protein
MKDHQLDILRKKLNPPAHGYSLLLLSLVGLWLVAPFFGMANIEEVTNAIFITAMAIAACYTMSDQGKSFVIVIVLAGLLMVTMWLGLSATKEQWALVAASVTGVFFFGLVAYEILVDILSKGKRVSMNLIFGATAVYLLIGVCFAYLYSLIFTLDPNAFRGVPPEGGAPYHFTYFSFVTLTTLGYGDITPLTRVGGSFATLEAIVGQLYLTILVARLVGMHISQTSGE